MSPSNFRVITQARCVQLRVLDDSDNKADKLLWDEFFLRIKECIVASFESCINNYEEEIRKLDAKRLQPGWNFSHFFLLKVDSA